MKCDRCQDDFNDNLLELSHDIPKYIGGTDADGRHYLCKKCHDVYEKTIFAVMTKNLSKKIKDEMIVAGLKFASNYFKKDGTQNK